MYRPQELATHVEDLSGYLAHRMVTHHGPGFRENVRLAVAYPRITHCLAVRGQTPPLAQLGPGWQQLSASRKQKPLSLITSSSEERGEVSYEAM